MNCHIFIIQTASVLEFDICVLTGHFSVLHLSKRQHLVNRPACLHGPGACTHLIEKTQPESMFIRTSNMALGPGLGASYLQVTRSFRL